MLQKLFIIAGVFMLAVTGASAEDAKPLTEDEAKRFVASLDSVETLRKDLEAQGKATELEINTRPKAGEEFKPYSRVVEAIHDQYPAEHAKLNGAVKPHGFNAKSWGEAGDKVMIAYLATKMDEENPNAKAQMAAMDKSMLEMMPPNVKEQFAAAMVMLETVGNAPESDKKAVAVVRDDLEAFMNREQNQ